MARMSDSGRVPTSTPLSRWLTELAQPTGAPGGGAAAGVMLGMSAALLHMVAEYTPDDPRAAHAAGRLAARRTEALAAAEADGVQSLEFGTALRLPAHEPTRDERVRDAALAAGRSSARLGEVGLALLPELRLLVEIGNPSLTADLAVGAEALVTGLAGASINLRANLQTARRHDARGVQLRELNDVVRRLADGRSAAQRIAGDASARLDE